MVGVVVYSIVGCPHCKAAKARLAEEGIQFLDVSVDRFPAPTREWVRDRTGKTSVPQIFFHDRHIGGNAELQQLLDSPAAKQEALALLAAGPEDEAMLPMVPHPGEALETGPEETDFVCEPDELSELAGRLVESGLLQRSGLLGSGPRALTGAALLSFLAGEGREPKAGQQMLDNKLLVGLAGETELLEGSRYTLHHLLGPAGLNTGRPADCKVRPADAMARDLRKVVLNLFADFLSADGRQVDYKGMAASPHWEKFTLMATQLQRVDVENLSDDQKLAFFINVYNVLVIHGTVVKGVPGGLLQRYKFFANTSYNIGGHLLSLNDIENGILRSNRSAMATLYCRPFSASDPRLRLVLSTVDPRIHFALNCGAKSCPPIKTFSGAEVQEQLQVATQAFLEGEDALVVEPGANLVRLSMLFKWYAVDFGANKDEVLAWVLAQLAEPVKRDQLEQVVKGGAKVEYLHYDWGNNSKD